MKINCSCLLDCALYASNISNYYDDLFLQKEGSCQMLSGVKFIAYFTFYLFFLMECGFQTACTWLFLLMLGLLP